MYSQLLNLGTNLNKTLQSYIKDPAAQALLLSLLVVFGTAIGYSIYKSRKESEYTPSQKT